MGVARRPEYCLFFVATLFSSPDTLESALKELHPAFGPVLFTTDPFPWDVSDYYAPELGSPLRRSFVFFAPVVETSGLAEAKVITCGIEDGLAMAGKRRVNLDPGYVTLAKVVLASRKNYSHRINLGRGVFAELELYCEAGGFRPLPYTYLDYRDARNIAIFNDARLRLKNILKQGRTGLTPPRG